MTLEQDLTPVSALGLSDRITEALKEAEITDAEDLMLFNRSELIALPGIGEASADDILKAVKAYESPDLEGVVVGDGTGQALPEIIEGNSEALNASPQTVKALELASEVERLTSTIRWAIDVFLRQRRGTQGQHIAGMLSQAVLEIRPDLSHEALHEMRGELPIKSPVA